MFEKLWSVPVSIPPSYCVPELRAMMLKYVGRFNMLECVVVGVARVVVV